MGPTHLPRSRSEQRVGVLRARLQAGVDGRASGNRHVDSRIRRREALACHPRLAGVDAAVAAVRALSAHQPVDACVPDESIVSGVAGEDVVAPPTRQRVVVGIANKLVVSFPSAERVVAVAAGHPVIAAETEDDIVASGTGDSVVARRPEDHVVTGGAHGVHPRLRRSRWGGRGARAGVGCLGRLVRVRSAHHDGELGLRCPRQRDAGLADGVGVEVACRGVQGVGHLQRDSLPRADGNACSAGRRHVEPPIDRHRLGLNLVGAGGHRKRDRAPRPGRRLGGHVPRHGGESDAGRDSSRRDERDVDGAIPRGGSERTHWRQQPECRQKDSEDQQTGRTRSSASEASLVRPRPVEEKGVRPAMSFSPRRRARPSTVRARMPTHVQAGCQEA